LCIPFPKSRILPSWTSNSFWSAIRKVAHAITKPLTRIKIFST
jgi:hypothetical protein